MLSLNRTLASFSYQRSYPHKDLVTGGLLSRSREVDNPCCEEITRDGSPTSHEQCLIRR